MSTSFMLFSGGLFSRKQRQKHQKQHHGSTSARDSQRMYSGNYGPASNVAVTIHTDRSARTSTAPVRPRVDRAVFASSRHTMRPVRTNDISLPIHLLDEPPKHPRSMSVEPRLPTIKTRTLNSALAAQREHEFNDMFYESQSNKMDEPISQRSQPQDVGARRFSENQYMSARVNHHHEHRPSLSVTYGHEQPSSLKVRPAVHQTPSPWEGDFYDDEDEDEGPLNPLEVLEEFFNDVPGSAWLDAAMSSRQVSPQPPYAPQTATDSMSPSVSQRTRPVSDPSFLSPSSVYSSPQVFIPIPSTSSPPQIPRFTFPNRLRRNSSVTSRTTANEGKWAEFNSLFRSLSNRDAEEQISSVPIHQRPLPPVPRSPPPEAAHGPHSAGGGGGGGRLRRARKPSVWRDSIDEAAEGRKMPSPFPDTPAEATKNVSQPPPPPPRPPPQQQRPLSAVPAAMRNENEPPPSSPVVAHIIPPAERARIGSSRRDSISSQSSQESTYSTNSLGTLGRPRLGAAAATDDLSNAQPIPSSPFCTAHRRLVPSGLNPPPRPMSVATQATASPGAVGPFSSCSSSSARPLSPPWGVEFLDQLVPLV